MHGATCTRNAREIQPPRKCVVTAAHAWTEQPCIVPVACTSIRSHHNSLHQVSVFPSATRQSTTQTVATAPRLRARARSATLRRMRASKPNGTQGKFRAIGTLIPAAARSNARPRKNQLTQAEPQRLTNCHKSPKFTCWNTPNNAAKDARLKTHRCTRKFSRNRHSNTCSTLECPAPQTQFGTGRAAATDELSHQPRDCVRERSEQRCEECAPQNLLVH